MVKDQIAEQNVKAARSDFRSPDSPPMPGGERSGDVILRKNIVFPYSMHHRDQIDLEEAIMRSASSTGVWGGE